MKLTIIYEGNVEMQDMLARVNSEQLQKIMTVIMDAELSRAPLAREENNGIHSRNKRVRQATPDRTE